MSKRTKTEVVWAVLFALLTVVHISSSYRYSSDGETTVAVVFGVTAAIMVLFSFVSGYTALKYHRQDQA